MKRLIIILSLLSHPLLARDYRTQIEQLNLEYNLPSGVAQSDFFEFEHYSFPTPTEYNLELQGSILILETPDGPIQLDSIPSFLTDVDQIKIKSLYLNHNEAVVDLKFNQFFFSKDSSNKTIKNVKFNCPYNTPIPDFLEQLFSSCLNDRANLSLNSFDSNGNKVVSDVKVKINSNQLDFELRALGLKIKGEGKTYYQDDLIRIKIEKARVGIINVRGRLFDELEKFESDYIKVNEPWVEIDTSQIQINE
jgi:hypothetical protein